MNHGTTQRIRRAAILVACLEESLAEQMLDSLPPAEAEKVMAELDRLEPIDPEEQQDVLDEFRIAGRTARTGDDSVEFTYSAPRGVSSQAAVTTDAAVEATAERTASEQVGDAELIAELLAPEHPQTIAAALSRMGNEQGAAVFAALPPTLQNDVLDRIATLTVADEEAVNELESQLRQRIDEHRQRRERLAASIDMARRILARTPPLQRASLLARIAPDDSAAGPAVDHRASRDDHRIEVSSMPPRQAEFFASADRQRPPVEYQRAADFAGRMAESSTGQESADPIESLEDRSRELLELDDHALTAAMRVLDEQMVLRSLAASSDEFLQRIAQRLPRRQGARLRHLVRTLAPTRLTELRRAQYEFLTAARQCAAEVTAN